MMEFKKEKKIRVHMYLNESSYNKLRDQYGRDAGKVMDMLLKDFLDQTPEITDETTFNPEVVNPFQRKRSRPSAGFFEDTEEHQS